MSVKGVFAILQIQNMPDGCAHIWRMKSHSMSNEEDIVIVNRHIKTLPEFTELFLDTRSSAAVFIRTKGGNIIARFGWSDATVRNIREQDQLETQPRNMGWQPNLLGMLQN